MRFSFFVGSSLGMLFLSVPSNALFAAPVASKPKPTPPAYQAVRAALFAHLEKQAQVQTELPAFPSQKLLLWVDNRHAQVDESPKARYALLGEHLLIAQKLLDSEELPARKQGLWIASESANFAASRLKSDKWLLARIYEGFLLPKISLANVQMWQDPSRGRILEAGVSAFGRAKERDKQIKVLEWLLSLGENPLKSTSSDSAGDALILEPNTLDWARGTLASVLFETPNAKQSDIERALALLQAIKSPDMKGFQHLQTRVQARLNQLQLKEQ